MKFKTINLCGKQVVTIAFSVVLYTTLAANTILAQPEAVAVSQSNLTGIALPSGAVRIQAQSVPAGITQILQKMIEAGEGKLQQGDSEVLAWTGNGYKKANGNALLNKLQTNLQAQGWTYEIGAKDGEITIFSASKSQPAQRDVVGFFVPTDDALVIAWTEVMPTNGAAQAKQKPTSRPAGKGNVLVGTWDNGGMSLMGDRNRVTGATTPSNGHTFKYVFTAEGRFENIGMMQSTQYGCTTTLFNDKRGTYSINGSTLTLVPDKNFWRQQNSCAPNSTKEREYTLTPETYQWRTKTDEFGKPFICLANDKGESCYRRVEK